MMKARGHYIQSLFDFQGLNRDRLSFVFMDIHLEEDVGSINSASSLG